MIKKNEIRWKQRFENFQKAFQQLQDAINEVEKNPDHILLRAGLIQTYEFTFELAWKTLKDYLTKEGFDVPSPRKTLRTAYQEGYIQDGHLWIKALDERNILTHAYDEEIALKAVYTISHTYISLLEALYTFLNDECQK
jgi:nucleotidyltransferase substrate binding protein (TIGR01987 family)